MKTRIGICQWSIPVQNAEESLSFAAKLGLEGIEPDLGSYEQDFPLSRKEEQNKYKIWRENLGIIYPSLAINALCQYGMSDSGSKKIAELAIAKAVETAAVLDIPIVQLPSFVKGDIVSGEDFQNTVACLRYACKCAEGINVIIGSENALTAEDQLAMIEAVNSKHFKIYFDTRNLFSMKGYDSVRIMEILLPHICEIHIKDGIDNGASTLLGKGNSGFFDAMRLLSAYNYTGWLLLENNYAAMSKEIQIPAEALLREDIDTVKSVQS
ncbi:MAG: sugar phosphate isomerase/epimerase [Anaerolineales bacterium]|nr:MAG: sugar phosphate isomerase/epimerase [Anaerolineales bacterium]